MVNNSDIFYAENAAALTADYNDNTFKFQKTFNNMKIRIETGKLEYSITGPDNNRVHGVIKAADGFVDFSGLSLASISLKSSDTSGENWRVWAW
jgi:hypothetical protein